VKGNQQGFFDGGAQGFLTAVVYEETDPGRMRFAKLQSDISQFCRIDRGAVASV
jgi:hypothetical protein